MEIKKTRTESQRKAISVARTTHGMTKSGEYRIWRGMRQRCYRNANADYARYGGRGITVCDRWRDSFQCFFDDMGLRPSDKHSLDRIDNDGNYEPENCRWATQVQQCSNKQNNHIVTYNGKSQTLTAWGLELGIHKSTLSKRLGLYGMTVEEAFTKSIEETISHNGKTQTLTEWANEIGITYQRLHSRLYRQEMPVDKALTARKMIGAVEYASLLIFNGESKTVAEWALDKGLKSKTIYSRLKAGWTVERTLVTPLRKTVRKKT